MSVPFRLQQVGPPLSRRFGRGFTLLEILVAMAVLAVVLLAVYRLQAQSISMTRHARFQAVAPLLARQKIAELDLAGIETRPEKSGEFNAPFAGYRWRLQVADTRSSHLGETAERLKRIDLTISRDADGLEYQVQTYRFFDR